MNKPSKYSNGMKVKEVRIEPVTWPEDAPIPKVVFDTLLRIAELGRLEKERRAKLQEERSVNEAEGAVNAEFPPAEDGE